MGLRLKFNLVLIIVFLAGFAAAGFISRQLLQQNARDEVVRNARLMMETAISVRTYTVTQIAPHLIKQLEEVFLPQTVPAYAATEAILQLQKKYPDYSYKEATLNPTNPRDRAAD
jgi:protein-histidine pros-kinase